MASQLIGATSAVRVALATLLVLLTSRRGALLAQVETSRVRLKYLGQGFLALVFMIGTLAGRAGGFLALLVFRLTGGAD